MRSVSRYRGDRARVDGLGVAKDDNATNADATSDDNGTSDDNTTNDNATDNGSR